MKLPTFTTAQQASSSASSEIHLKPRLTRLLQTLGLDVIYERGSGDYLFYRNEQNREVEVLDLIGGYGSLLLGHGHPALVAAAQEFLTSGRPIHAQGSKRALGEQLAQELSDRAGGGFRVVLANSGAEAVEAALKHAMLETGARTFLALENGFHGKTLGALQLTGNMDYRAPYALAGLNVVRVRRNDRASLEAAFARTGDLAGFLFEPIQGEGGVWPIETEFARRAAELCAGRKIPLIADECQTGLGRTGTFLACEGFGVRPDYLIPSKTLGGGLAKIAALLIDRTRYCDVFDLQHMSTFAEDDYSCALALKTLELIDQRLMDRCRERGERLLTGLRQLHQRYPDVIAGVRGRGLLLGLEFLRLSHSPSFLIRYLSSQDYLIPLLAGYLLRTHRIRIAPTLSDPFTLRLEPSAFISDASIQHLFSALDTMCLGLRNQDTVGLTSFLNRAGPCAGESIAPRSQRLFVLDEGRFQRQQQYVPSQRVAWLCHFINADDYSTLEPAMGDLSGHRREQFLNRLAAVANPVVLSAVDIQSRQGGRVRLYPILLPVTSRWMKHWIDTRQFAWPRSLVERGVDLARCLGCQLVSLGQYTSIVTLNGTTLAAGDMGLTTGNSYAIALAVQALERAHRERGFDPNDLVVAVVGAAGNIGRTCVEMLAPRYRRVLLVGKNKPGSRSRLMELAQRHPNADIATDLTALVAADAVVAATNAVDPPLRPEHFAAGAIVCDLSVPAGTRPDLETVRPDLLLIQGGTVRLPFEEDLEIPGFPLPRGHMYACMAEGILLGFEGGRDASLTGLLRPDQVRWVEALAQRHGFELADYKKKCVLCSEPREAIYECAR